MIRTAPLLFGWWRSRTGDGGHKPWARIRTQRQRSMRTVLSWRRAASIASIISMQASIKHRSVEWLWSRKGCISKKKRRNAIEERKGMVNVLAALANNLVWNQTTELAKFRDHVALLLRASNPPGKASKACEAENAMGERRAEGGLFCSTNY